MGVQFNEEESLNQAYQKNTESVSGLTKWFIDKGIAKDEKSAKTSMTIVSLIFFALAIYIMFI